MTFITTYGWLLRPIFSLLFGYFIARRMRQLLLSLAMRTTPVAHRYTEEGFKKQTKVASRLGIGLTVLIAISIEIGYRQILLPNKLNTTKITQTKIPFAQELTMTPLTPFNPPPKQKTAPTNQAPPPPETPTLLPPPAPIPAAVQPRQVYL